MSFPEFVGDGSGGSEERTYFLYITKLRFFFSFFYLFILVFRAITVAYGGSQARGLIGAVAAGLRHSHNNAISELCLRSTPQLTAMPDP